MADLELQIRGVLQEHRWNFHQVWDTLCSCGWGNLGTPVAQSFTQHQVEMLRPVISDHVAAVEADRDGLRRLFDLQQTRMMEATERWRAESPVQRELIAPDLGDLLAWLMARADRAEAEVKRLSNARLVMAIFGTPEEGPQPFALVNSDPQPERFAYGVQWPGGAVTVKPVDPERLGNVTCASLDDFMTLHGQADVVWLAEDLGTLADAEERAENALRIVVRVTGLLQEWNRLGRGDGIHGQQLQEALKGKTR